MLSVRSRRLPRGPRPLLVAALIVFGAAGNAAAFDNLRVLYGLRESGEYDDNLFSSTQGKIRDVAINTNPDVSFLYDDGKTRWLARGNYRRQSFVRNWDARGDYYAFSGEFSRELDGRHTFSILGGYTVSSSIEPGQPLTEPGQIQVIIPQRGAQSRGISWSPSITSFWSRRFSTTLSYEDTESLSSGGSDLFQRSITLSGGYALSPEMILQVVLQGGAVRNSGLPFAEEQDTNTFTAQVGFSQVVTPRITLQLTAGPQWTREINSPDEVTLIRNFKVKVTDPVFGTSEQVFVKEPNLPVEDTAASLAFTLGIVYQIDQRTRFTLGASRSTDSGQGVSGSFEQDEIRLALSRKLGHRWNLNIGGGFQRSKSISREVSIQTTIDPDTGQREALDVRSFDIPQRLDLTQIFFQPRLDFRINRWWTAFLGWDHTRFETKGSEGSSYNANRVMLGIEFRNEERF